MPSVLGRRLPTRSPPKTPGRSNSSLRRCASAFPGLRAPLTRPSKVYLPCVLLAKKRYVGFSYETEKVIEPAFDAKGIETVRRDGILATQKMQEMSLKCAGLPPFLGPR